MSALTNLAAAAPAIHPDKVALTSVPLAAGAPVIEPPTCLWNFRVWTPTCPPRPAPEPAPAARRPASRPLSLNDEIEGSGSGALRFGWRRGGGGAVKVVPDLSLYLSLDLERLEQSGQILEGWVEVK